MPAVSTMPSISRTRSSPRKGLPEVVLACPAEVPESYAEGLAQSTDSPLAVTEPRVAAGNAIGNLTGAGIGQVRGAGRTGTAKRPDPEIREPPVRPHGGRVVLEGEPRLRQPDPVVAVDRVALGHLLPQLGGRRPHGSSRPGRGPGQEPGVPGSIVRHGYSSCDREASSSASAALRTWASFAECLTSSARKSLRTRVSPGWPAVIWPAPSGWRPGGRPGRHQPGPPRRAALQPRREKHGPARRYRASGRARRQRPPWPLAAAGPCPVPGPSARRAAGRPAPGRGRGRR